MIKINKKKKTILKRQYIEILGLLSVIASLLFVGVEIRQNTTAIRGATQQDISYQISEIYKIAVENEKIALITSKAYQGITKKDLSEIDFSRFWLFAMMGLRRVENIYLQYNNGFVGSEAFDRIDMAFYRTPLVREIWEERKNSFDPEFVVFYENLEKLIFISFLKMNKRRIYQENIKQFKRGKKLQLLRSPREII